MKKILLFTLIIVLMTSLVHAQEGKNKFPEYQDVIQVDKTSDEIYSNLKSWIATTFNSANDVIQLDDVTNKKIIIKGISTFAYKRMVTINGKVFFTLTLEAKDNRFRYTIIFTNVEVGTNHQSAMSELIEKPNSKNSKLILPEIEKIRDNLVLGMKNSNLGNSNDDW